MVDRVDGGPGQCLVLTGGVLARLLALPTAGFDGLAHWWRNHCPVDRAHEIGGGTSTAQFRVRQVRGAWVTEAVVMAASLTATWSGVHAGVGSFLPLRDCRRQPAVLRCESGV